MCGAGSFFCVGGAWWFFKYVFDLLYLFLRGGGMGVDGLLL